jgi:HPt (histidine-containing phosphotransfer) domain-containing protein
MELGETLKLDRWEIINAMFQGAETPLERVVDVFFAGAEECLERIRAGREQSRRDWCVNASHSLKSSSANLGLERVSVLSAHLENNAETMGAGELDQMILILSVELGEARRAISAQMKEIL